MIHVERKFKSGDVVRLKSDEKDNVPMTIRGYQIDIEMSNPQNKPFLNEFKHLEDNVVCDWRDKSDKPQTQTYKENELIKVKFLKNQKA